MAATKIDALFQRISEDFKEIILEEGDKRLSRVERLLLAEVGVGMAEVWDAYLDRLIAEVAADHPDPEGAVAEAGADQAEMEAAQKRVHDKLEASGAIPKKPTIH